MLGRPGQKPLGVIRKVGDRSIVNLQAECKIKAHGRCRCWVSARDDKGVSPQDLLNDMASWIARSDNSDVAEHQRLAKELKASYGLVEKN